MFKNMTDSALTDAIVALRALAANNVAMKRRGGSTGRILRDLDIAVAVKRGRMRAGTWTGPDTV